MHLDDGQLRALLDDQPADESARRHLAACPECRTRQAGLAARAARVQDRLARLDPAEPAPATAALSRLMRRQEEERPAMLRKLLRPALALAALAVILSALALPPVRIWAGEFLGLFRVQQVEVLPVDTTGLSALAGDETLSRQISQLMGESVTLIHEPAPPQSASTPEEAGRLAGFTLRLPATGSRAPALTVSDRAAFEIVVDRQRAQTLLDEAGYGEVSLPASLDGARIRVDIPAGVTAAYGVCPDPEAQGDGRPEDWDALRECVLLAQFPSPTVETPPDLDLEQLARIGLQLTGMSPEEARAFSQNVDWTTTLVIPIPSYGHSYKQVEVDGVTGSLIERRPSEDYPARYALIWVRGGIIYALSGFGLPEPGLALARSLR